MKKLFSTIATGLMRLYMFLWTMLPITFLLTFFIKNGTICALIGTAYYFIGKNWSLLNVIIIVITAILMFINLPFIIGIIFVIFEILVYIPWIIAFFASRNGNNED